MTTIGANADTTRPPKILADPRLREAVRDLLVVLPQSCPGLGLKVTGPENAVLLYPRGGKPIDSLPLLELAWYSVDVPEGRASLGIEKMERGEVQAFLDMLRPALPR